MNVSEFTAVMGWGIALIIAVPLLIVILSEIVERLRRRNSAYLGFFELLRVGAIPAIAAFVIVSQLTTIDSDRTLYRAIASLALLACAYAGFRLTQTINAVEDPARWEARSPGLFKVLLRLFVVLYPVYILISFWGIDLSRSVTALGVGSLVIALALQDTLSSIVSGFLLVVDKPFAVGDWISVDDNEGIVVDISWRSTRLQVNHDVIVIPNVTLASSSILNQTLADPAYRETITLDCSADAAPNEVKSVLLALALDSPAIAKTPPPEVFTTSFGDSSNAYELSFLVAEYRGPLEAQRIRDELMTRSYYAIERAGLSSPPPIVLNQTMADLEVDTTSAAAEAFEFLKWHRFFGLLPDEILERLSHEVTLAVYGEREIVVHKGRPAESLGIVRAGTLEILGHGTAPTDDPSLTAKLGPGDIVGEMSLMGRRSNTVSAVAATDATLLEIKAATMRRIVAQHPRFAHELNSLIERRNLSSIETDRIAEPLPADAPEPAASAPTDASEL